MVIYIYERAGTLGGMAWMYGTVLDFVSSPPYKTLIIEKTLFDFSYFYLEKKLIISD